jgi:hypothetical protein
LGIVENWGLRGLWWGLAMGLSVLSLCVVGWLIFVVRGRRQLAV